MEDVRLRRRSKLASEAAGSNENGLGSRARCCEDSETLRATSGGRGMSEDNGISPSVVVRESASSCLASRISAGIIHGALQLGQLTEILRGRSVRRVIDSHFQNASQVGMGPAQISSSPRQMTANDPRRTSAVTQRHRVPQH